MIKNMADGRGAAPAIPFRVLLKKHSNNPKTFEKNSYENNASLRHYAAGKFVHMGNAFYNALFKSPVGVCLLQKEQHPNACLDMLEDFPNIESF